MEESNSKRKIVIRVIASTLLLVMVLTGGYILVNNFLARKKGNKYPQFKDITKLDSKLVSEINLDGVNYTAPEGYLLEEVNGNVHAVKKYYEIIPATRRLLANNVYEYYVPSNYTLYDGFGYREIIVYEEPIVHSVSK